MKENWSKITVISVAIVFYGFALLCWFKPADDISEVERRELAKMPELSMDSFAEGSFMDEFEEYAVDQIPFRQGFRTVKAAIGIYALGQLDNNDLYVDEGYIIDMEYPLDVDSIERAADRFTDVYNKYLLDTDVNVYMSIIPDKNYFNDNDVYPIMEHDKMVGIMCENMEYSTYIDVFGELKLEDYYKTDTHWRQEKIISVAEKLGTSMGVNIDTEYEQMKVDKTFYGVYYGQMSLPNQGDELYYLINPNIDDCTVYDYENNRNISMYDMDAATGRDPYEMYLYGPLSLVTITNPNADTGKELIIFRDSFGSSIAPLLATGYSKVTLVDIRYISPEILGNFIEFDNQDVLFLYSTSVLNNSETIK